MDRLVPATVLAFALGIALHRLLSPGAAAAALLLLAALLAAAGRRPFLRRLLPAPLGARLPPLLLALAAACGAARSAADSLPPAERSLRRLLPDRPVPVEVAGVVLRAPDPPGPGSGQGREPVATLVLEAAALATAAGPVEARGRVLVRVEEGTPDLLPGDAVRVRGVARPPGDFRNPGVPPREEGADRILEAPGPGAVRRTAEACPLRPARAAALLRRAVLRGIGRAAPGPGGAFLEALLVGEDRNLDGGIVRDFRRAGVWHVLVVSGLHAALAAAAAARLLGAAGAGARVRSAGALLAAAAVAGASGFGQPALRATLAIALAAAAPLVRRRSDPVHAVFAAAGLFLALRPSCLAEAGFQLTCAAVLGLLLLSPPLGRLLFARRRFHLRFPVPAADRSPARRAGDFLDRWLPPSLAAWLATAPILAHHFGAFSPVAPLANLLVVPATSLLLVASPAILLAGTILPGATGPLLDGFAALLAAAVGAAAGLPGAFIPVAPHPVHTVLLGAALAAAALRPSPRRLLVAAAGTALLPVLPPAAPFPAPSVLVMDVGHGLAVLADSGRARVLLDAGGRSERVAEDAILPALRARGVVALDGLLLSHEDADHYAAAAAILGTIPVGVVVVNGEFGATDRGREVFAAAARAGVPVLRTAAGDRMAWNGLSLEILHPPRGGGGASTDNEGSLVVRVSMEGLSALVTGDVGEEGVRRLLLSGGDLRADLLVLPHHGSPGTPGVDALAAATGARLLVASAGRGTAVRGPVGAPGCPRFLVTAREGAVEAAPLR